MDEFDKLTTFQKQAVDWLLGEEVKRMNYQQQLDWVYDDTAPRRRANEIASDPELLSTAITGYQKTPDGKKAMAEQQQHDALIDAYGHIDRVEIISMSGDRIEGQYVVNIVFDDRYDPQTRFNVATKVKQLLEENGLLKNEEMLGLGPDQCRCNDIKLKGTRGANASPAPEVFEQQLKQALEIEGVLKLPERKIKITNLSGDKLALQDIMNHLPRMENTDDIQLNIGGLNKTPTNDITIT